VRRGIALLVFGLLLSALGDAEVAAAGPLAFVTGFTSSPGNRIAVVDTATGAVVNSFDDGANDYPGAVVLSPGGSVIEFRRRPSIKRLKRGRFRVDTGIDVICGASATGCGGSQATTVTLPRKAARSARLVLARTSFPARANSRARLLFTVSGRKARRLGRYGRLRFTTTVATHDHTGAAVKNVRKYALKIPARAPTVAP
jgi:hypothetical protein